MPNASCSVSSLAPVTQCCNCYNEDTGLSLIDWPTAHFPQRVMLSPCTWHKQVHMLTNLQTNEQFNLCTYVPAHTHTHTHICNLFPSYDYQFCYHKHLLVMAKTVDSLRGVQRHTQEYVSTTIIPIIHGISLCALSTRNYLYSHALHNDVNSVNDGPHIWRWSHNIIILYYNTYHCITIAYSIQYSNMLYRFVA